MEKLFFLSVCYFKIPIIRRSRFISLFVRTVIVEPISFSISACILFSFFSLIAPFVLRNSAEERESSDVSGPSFSSCSRSSSSSLPFHPFQPSRLRKGFSPGEGVCLWVCKWGSVEAKAKGVEALIIWVDWLDPLIWKQGRISGINSSWLPTDRHTLLYL